MTVATEIKATLDGDEACRRFWDVVVVGAGPAGALAARELAKLGREVLLVDRSSFPRYKVCGACLNGRAIATLADAGLGRLPAENGATPIGRFVCAGWGGRAELPLHGGVAISRRALDAALINAGIDEGVEFLPSTTATPGPHESDFRSVKLKPEDGGEHLVRCRLVVAADGLAGRFLGKLDDCRPSTAANSYIGAGMVAPAWAHSRQPGVVYMAVGDQGYVGGVCVEDGSLNIAAALSASWVRKLGGLAPTADAILRQAGFPPLPAANSESWRGTPPLTRRAAALSADRLLVLGDAAGYVEPFTGEGMAWALESATALAPLAHTAVDRWTADVGREWARLHVASVGRRQRLCWWVSGVLRKPLLTRLSLMLLRRLPGLATPVLGRLSA